jgi:hypothetical protein
MDKEASKNFLQKFRWAVDNHRMQLRLNVEQARGLYMILQKWKSGIKLTEAERRFATEQMLKIAFGIPALTIFLMPFGSIILVLLLKYLPIQTLAKTFHKII